MVSSSSDATSAATGLSAPVAADRSPAKGEAEAATQGLHAAPKRELRRFRAYTYWSLVGVSAFLLLLFSVTGQVPYPPALPGIVVFGGIAVVIAAMARLAAQRIPRVQDGSPMTKREWWLWAASGMVAATSVAATWSVYGEAWLWAIAPAAVGSLVVAGIPRQRRRLATMVMVAGAIGLGVLVGAIRDEPAMAHVLLATIAVAFWASLTMASVWTWDVVVQLDEARRTASDLAVANERLRFAGDLHDIQGHSLQVIALKSELASRLAGTDPTAAAAEMEAVRELAADALRDTRSVVEGYRRTSLDTEIANASNVLGSVGIDVQLHLDDALDLTALPQQGRHLLGLVVREAVTNVLRHSTATEAAIELRADPAAGRARLEVRNDGAAPTSGEERGGGLSQLAGRLHEVGGELTWERRGDRFTIHAGLPARTTGTPEEAR